MGIFESKFKNSRVAKQNGDVKKSKTFTNGVANGHCYLDLKTKGNEGSKTMNASLRDGENISKKMKKNKILQSRKPESGKVTNNSGHKSNHGKTKEDSDQKNKWNTIPRSAHSTIERLIKSFDYQIVEFNVNIDEKSSILAEKTSVLKYKTPHFRAKASVIVPALEKGDQAVVGWIQVVNSMIFVNRYGDYGLSSWEFPELTTGRQMMISDSDGHRYPWYGSKKEVAVLKGPTSSPSMLTVIMNDNFSPQVTWFMPAPNHRKTCKQATLTKVFRKQSFTACLAVMKVATNGSLNTQTEIHQSPFNPDLSTASSSPYNGLSILRGIKWELKVDINIDPSKNIGERSSIPNGHLSTNQYFTINDPDILAGILDLSALHPPNANKSQTLIWRPFTLSMLRPRSTSNISNAISKKNYSSNKIPTETGSTEGNKDDTKINCVVISENSYNSDDVHKTTILSSLSVDNLSNGCSQLFEQNFKSTSSSFSSSPSSSNPSNSLTLGPSSPTASSNKLISTSLCSFNNLLLNPAPSSLPNTKPLTAPPLSSSFSPSSLTNQDKNPNKFISSASTEPLNLDRSISLNSPSPPQTQHYILPNSTFSSTKNGHYPHNNNPNELIHPIKAYGTTKKSRVITNDRNKLHQFKAVPYEISCAGADNIESDVEKLCENIEKNYEKVEKFDEKVGDVRNVVTPDFELNDLVKNEALKPLKTETVIVQPSYTKVDMLGYLRMTRGLSRLLHKCVVNELEEC